MSSITSFHCERKNIKIRTNLVWKSQSDLADSVDKFYFIQEIFILLNKYLK